MEGINDKNKLFYWACSLRFFIILALPILTIPPYFFPPDFGKSIVFRSVLTILLLVFLWQMFYGKTRLALPAAIKKSSVVWAFLALFGAYLLASIFSIDPYFSFWGSPYRGGGFVTLAFLFIFAAITFVIFKKDDWAKAWDFSILIGAIVSLVAVIQYFGLLSNIFLASPSRPASTMGNPELLATYLLLLSFFTLTLAISSKILWKKTAYFSSLALFLYVILITQSRAAYLGLAVAGLYFFLCYPKKMRAIKIATLGLLVVAAGFVFYANTINRYPAFLQHNTLFTSVTNRMSASLLLTDPRFYAWTEIDYKILAARPILGYGPENFSVGFNKYYDPSIPYLEGSVSWWDRAHNIIIQTASDAGILGLLAYVSLFVLLFWQLQKVKSSGSKSTDENSLLTPHAIQATLIGYITAIFFSFDSFSTYLIFFLLCGYSLYIIYGRPREEEAGKRKQPPWKLVCMLVLLIVAIIFLWQYNLVPLQVNAQINSAQSFVDAKQCDQAFSIMDNILPEHSFLDSYARLEYVEFTQTCAELYPQNKIGYLQKGMPLISQALKIQPLYTRYWIYLATSSDDLAAQEKDPVAKSNLLAQAAQDLNQAQKLAPKHQEIPIEQAHMEMIAGNYQAMQNYAKTCIALNPSLGDCYWYLALSQIYVKDITGAKTNIQIAGGSGYAINSEDNLNQLADAYYSIADYQDLVSVYQQLIAINPNSAQYHSSLAFFYKALGEYNLARQQALIVLQISPQSKPNVDAFLATLPQ